LRKELVRCNAISTPEDYVVLFPDLKDRAAGRSCNFRGIAASQAANAIRHYYGTIRHASVLYWHALIIKPVRDAQKLARKAPISAITSNTREKAG
jgi:hypothetical protein